MSILAYGWDENWEKEWKERFDEPLFPGRVVADHGMQMRVHTDDGEWTAGWPAFRNEGPQAAVGDWVALEKVGGQTYVRGILPRRTKFSRAAAGPELKEQIVAANVDIVFLVQSLNRDFNMRRLERYLVSAWESGAVPVVVLTKADCCEDVTGKVFIAQETAPGVDVHAVSCHTGAGMEEIGKYFTPGKTVALLGSSGVGKSTLVNTLSGQEVLKVREIRADDDRGRHTTTHRELLLLPDGALVMDTPGMRTMSIWEAETGMDAMFGDVEALARQCRFQDCRHEKEPGCAVREALRTGKLDAGRWESWRKLQKELAFLERKRETKEHMRDHGRKSTGRGPIQSWED